MTRLYSVAVRLSPDERARLEEAARKRWPDGKASGAKVKHGGYTDFIREAALAAADRELHHEHRYGGADNWQNCMHCGAANPQPSLIPGGAP